MCHSPCLKPSMVPITLGRTLKITCLQAQSGQPSLTFASHNSLLLKPPPFQLPAFSLLSSQTWTLEHAMCLSPGHQGTFSLELQPRPFLEPLLLPSPIGWLSSLLPTQYLPSQALSCPGSPPTHYPAWEEHLEECCGQDSQSFLAPP